MPAKSNPSEARLREIFAEALKKQAAEGRRRYLDEACGGDPGLRSRVESLLRAHERAGEFLELNAHGEDINLDTDAAGSVIGPYRLVEKLGAGGFGVVYRAEQTKPIQREVALKIIKLGMDTREVIARFEAERQALALMHHPNIAQVFDAGATEAGRPYFVMELVPGEPITDYCDAHQLPTEQRLQLFLQVCDAVQHAHKKGIVHRDLKPSNVVVTLVDEKPVPKVIDFGIAKMLHGREAGRTVLTRRELLLGTPAYMSPEQVALSGDDIDERSDIYSLGVLLYELLTGTMPFETETLRRRALDEIRRVIREENPPKPSTRLEGLGAKATEIAKHRQAEPLNLRRQLKGDLDWVVMKTLEKERSRRYDSASGLADDLLRHLHHRPVLAGPPSVVYRVRKFARRRRGALVAAGSIAAVLCAAAILSYWQSVRTREAEKRAAASRAELKTALSEPSAASRSADTQARGLFNGMALVDKEAALSPDERFLAYSDWSGKKGAVTVRQLESGKVWKFTGSGKDGGAMYEKAKELYAEALERIAGKRPGVAEMPIGAYTWSPDSQWLAYYSLSSSNSGLRVVSPKTGAIRVLVPPDPAVDYYPTDWSSDSKWILCYRNKGGLARVSVPDGQARELVPFEKPWPDHARVSPDGKYVVFSRPTGEGEPAKRPHALFVTEVATGTTRPLNLPGDCRTPIWSPTRPVILFTSDRLGSWDLWGVRVQEGKAASEPFPVQYGFGSFDLRLTRAGKLLVYRDVKPGDGYTVAVAGPASAPLKAESLPGRIYFTMNGRLHAMTLKDAKTTLTPLGYPGPPSRALHGGHRWFLEIRALPSAGTNQPRRELFVVRDDAEANQAIQLTDLPGIGQMAGMQVFAMGSIRAGQERDRIIGWARDAARGLEDGLISWAATKPLAPGPPTGPPSPPGIYLARVAFDSEGNITGLAEPLSSTPLVTNATTHDWSPDGRRLVFTKPGRTNVLQILEVGTRQAATLTEGEAPAWSPDGTWIAFHRGNASLHIIRPDSSGLRTLGRNDPPKGMTFLGPPRPGFYRAVWAPDSQALVYEFWSYGGLDNTYHELFYRLLGGGKAQCLTHDLMTDASPVAWLEGEK